MSRLTREISSQLSKVSDDARDCFGALSEEQINWQRTAASWSVGQCFDHLITAHSLYVPVLDQLASPQRVPSIWERVSPLSGFFGMFLIRSLNPENRKKMKTSAKALPSANRIDSGIIDRFCDHQDQLIDQIRRIPDAVDPGTIISSPLLRLVTYSLEDCLTILVVHSQRHSEQARRVMANAGFPRYHVSHDDAAT